jgi:aminodeoxyfutalosine synthase
MRVVDSQMRARFDEIEQKVISEERISENDALFLYQWPVLHDLGRVANIIRDRKNGNRSMFVFNRFINYSNICILSCQFCAFAKKKNDPEAFEYTIPQMVEQARDAVAQGITELHIVGGLHPKLPASYYLEMLRELKKVSPDLHLKIFTAIEIRHLADRIFKKSIQETLELLREAGLGSLTGGGAEIFDAGIRDQICRGKESAEEWLEVHKIWHQMGGRSTCTMLFGHLETYAHRVEHLRLLRALQDETGGFTAFVPFAFEPANTELAHIPRASSVEEIKNIAVSRIFLDNFDHVTAYWISMTPPIAQLALSYGADDLHGTIFEEKIFHMAGTRAPMEQKVAALAHSIREAGREPAQRDSLYRPIQSESKEMAGV